MRLAGGRSTRARSKHLVLTLESRSHTEASAFGRENPELRLDQILEPDWLVRPELESTESDYQNNLAHGMAELAIPLKLESFYFHDFRLGSDRSSLNANHSLACRGETGSYRTMPQPMMAKRPQSDKLPPPPIDHARFANELQPGSSLDDIGHTMTWGSHQHSFRMQAPVHGAELTSREIYGSRYQFC